MRDEPTIETILSSEHLEDLLAPHLLPFAPSGWHELVPVAHWLVQATRPRILVELGSHAGVSFTAFCSAMKRRNVDGKAFAVDTWVGDEHAGAYDETIYKGLKDLVDQNFKNFAHLLRMTFDEALGDFSDGTVDFLHIDGFHTYEAVKHDFESWRSKLSERGVVVFHDVNCRNPGFGVWRYWEELTREFPSFEFPHGNGLGVIVVGSQAPESVLALTQLKTPEAIAKVQAIFANAGHPHGQAYENHNQHVGAATLLKSDRDAVDQDRQRLDQECQRLDQVKESIDEDRQRIDQERLDLLDRNESLTIQNRKLEANSARNAVELKSVRRLYGRLLEEHKAAASGLVDAKRTLAETRSLHESIISSTSWRITHPLRLANARLVPHQPRIDLLKRSMRLGDNEARRVLFSSLKRRVGFPASQPVAQVATMVRPIISDNEKAKLVSLEQARKIPSVSAIVILDDASADRLENVVEAINAQLLPVRQILAFAATGSRARSRIETLAGKRSDIQPAWDLTLEQIKPTDAFLVMSGQVSIFSEATSVLATEMSTHGAEFVYCDEVFVGRDGQTAEPFYKPAYSPRLAAASHYMGACALVAVDSDNPLETLAELTEAAASKQDIEAWLTKRAALLQTGKVRRAPFVLFEETDERHKALPAPPVSPVVARHETVSIIIPTRDRLSLVQPCVESIVAKTNYPHDRYEIVIVDNGSTDQPTLDYLRKGVEQGTFKVLRDDSPFNYPKLNNLAARASEADVLVFLNNDTLIIQPDWLTRMVTAALDQGIGLVGAKLLYEDGTVQHGGVVLGIQGVAAHADVLIAPSAPGYHGLAQYDREVSAVTGACMATQRTRFWEVGGFDEELAVAFNDTLLCTNMLKAGYVNFQLNSVRVTHLESKSRGHDITEEQKDKFLSECRYARRHGQSFFLNDIYYNPNLSLQDTYKPAVIPRRQKPWRSARFNEKPRVLILSCTHQRGHGVPVVIEQHAAYLRERGFEVHVGGHASSNDIVYDGCTRVVLEDPFNAMIYAVSNDIDIVIPHTPPFFSAARWAGPYPFVAAYDHGEPPTDIFPDAVLRKETQREKNFSLSLSHRLYCNSHSVKNESGFPEMVVVPLGNSHMDRWTPDKAGLRQAVRERNGWSDKIVVLNVCRFHGAERHYKGVDLFIETADHIRLSAYGESADIVFVQCGKALPEDVEYVSAAGIECFANVSEEEMSELYCAADIYANFSQWEGWNLGIAQALAYGLPVIASDIDAHRKNFDVPLVSDAEDAGRLILERAALIKAEGADASRTAHVEEWASRLAPFVDDLVASWRAFND